MPAAGETTASACPMTLAVGLGMFLSISMMIQTKSSSRKEQARERASERATLRKFRTKKMYEHGSFLTAVDDNLSLAHKAAVDEHLKTVDAKSGSGRVENNERIGRELILARDKHMGPNVSVFYKQDGGLVVTSGKGSKMIDVDGAQYLDCCNNVAHVGHAHPTVVRAGQEELAKIQTNSRFLNPVQQRYIAKLLATFPPELDTVYLVNSGSEANDLALRMSREHAARRGVARPEDIICMDSAYHGHTQALVDISPYKWYQALGKKDYQPASTHVAPLPDGYRGKYPLGQTEECGRLYAQDVVDLCNATGGVGTFIAESVIGCGGQVMPPPSYLALCYAAVRAKGGVCIADEVQTGFGRSGTHFWAFESHGVVPDIVSVGKPMGNGYPVAAVICRREVAESFASTGIEYFNTYGGNSVACAVAEAVLDTIHAEKLQKNALVVGEHTIQKLQALKKQHSWIGDVRGCGLFLGVEFINPSAKGEGKNSSSSPVPYSKLTKFIVDHMRYDKVLVSRDGPDENVIKIKPPLVFSVEDADTLVCALESALRSARRLGVF